MPNTSERSGKVDVFTTMFSLCTLGFFASLVNCEESLLQNDMEPFCVACATPINGLYGSSFRILYYLLFFSFPTCFTTDHWLRHSAFTFVFIYSTQAAIRYLYWFSNNPPWLDSDMKAIETIIVPSCIGIALVIDSLSKASSTKYFRALVYSWAALSVICLFTIVCQWPLELIRMYTFTAWCPASTMCPDHICDVVKNANPKSPNKQLYPVVLFGWNESLPYSEMTIRNATSGNVHSENSAFNFRWQMSSSSERSFVERLFLIAFMCQFMRAVRQNEKQPPRESRNQFYRWIVSNSEYRLSKDTTLRRVAAKIREGLLLFLTQTFEIICLMLIGYTVWISVGLMTLFWALPTSFKSELSRYLKPWYEKTTRPDPSPSKVKRVYGAIFAGVFFFWLCAAHPLAVSLFVERVYSFNLTLSQYREAESPYHITQWAPWLFVGTAIVCSVFSGNENTFNNDMPLFDPGRALFAYSGDRSSISAMKDGAYEFFEWIKDPHTASQDVWGLEKTEFSVDSMAKTEI